jgi:catecholate siderophore receptor
MRKKTGKRAGKKVQKKNIAGLQGRPHWSITGALLASTVISAGAAKQAVAQGTGREPDRSPSQNPALPPRQFDIPAGHLKPALDAFETATGLQLKARVKTLLGFESGGVSGVLTPQEALDHLLSGTGLVGRIVGMHTIILERAHRHHDEGTLLEAVSVGGTASLPHTSSPKYTEPLRDVPQTVTIVPEQVIEEQHATSLRDIVRNVPGITINAGEGGATPGDNFNVRGFSARTDVFVDGVRDVGGYSRDAFNIEQIEVAQGPSSTYTGRGSTGGSINAVTKTPHVRTSRSASLSFGTADQQRFTTDINQSLDALHIPGAAVRLNAMWSDGGVPGNDVVKNKGWGVAPSLAIGMGTPTQLNLSYVNTRQNNIPSYGLQSFDSVPDVDTRHFFGLEGIDFERIATNQLTGRLDHDFGAQVHVRNQLTRGHSETNRIVTYTNLADGTRHPKSHITNDDIIANQTNLTASFATGALEHDIATGVEITHEKSLFGHYTIDGTPPTITDLNDPTPSTGFTPTITVSPDPREVTSNSVGVYAFETMKVGQHWEVTGGLRWDQYRPHYADTASHTTSTDAVTGRAGIVYKPTEAGSFYAAYGTSFNPSSEGLAYASASDIPPERNRSYEVGSKWDLFKQRLLATFAVFRTDKVNARTEDPDDPDALTVLKGKQRVDGAQVGLSGNITNRWSMLAGYTFLEGKYVKSADTSEVGDEFANVPKHSANVWTNYQVSRKLDVGAGIQVLDRRLLRSRSGATTWVPGYNTVNAMASYRLNPFVDLQLNLTNLTNETYYDNGRFWVPAPGRSVVATTSVKF